MARFQFRFQYAKIEKKNIPYHEKNAFHGGFFSTMAVDKFLLFESQQSRKKC